MRRKRIATLVFVALSVLNFLVGGLAGFICIRGEDVKVFAFIYAACLVAAAVCVVCDWAMLRQAAMEKPYRVLRLRKGRLVREERRMRPDTDGLRALQMGFSGWLFSLVVPLFAAALIWPELAQVVSGKSIFNLLLLGIALFEFVVEIVIAVRSQKERSDV